MNISVELTDAEIKEAIRYWLEHSKNLPSPTISSIKLEYVQAGYSNAYHKATASLDGKLFEETQKKKVVDVAPNEPIVAGKKAKVSLDVD